MRDFLVVAAVATATFSATAAQGQYAGQYGYGRDNGGYSSRGDWNDRRSSFALFEQEYRHTIEGIRHGLRDGTFSRWQADRFYRELESIRYYALRSMRSGGYQNRYIQARLEQLHERMHFRHEMNHEREDEYGSYGSYGRYDNGHGDYGRQDGHDHDNDDD